LLTSPAEQRLARVLLRLAYLDKKRPSAKGIPTLSDQVLAEMVGNHALASEPLHESIQEARIYPLQR
jgi:hypothetical protein